MLLLAQSDVEQILTAFGSDGVMDRIIERLTEGLAEVHAGRAAMSPTRDGFLRSHPVPGIIEWMPHRVDGASTTIKTVSYSPANPQQFGLPTIAATVAQFDDVTGQPTALCDGALLTAMRTGAASAIATRVLSAPGSGTVGVIGTGAQAVTQLHALSRVMPIERVLAWDVCRAHLLSYTDRVAFLNLKVEEATPEEVGKFADVIVTATSVGAGAGPVFEDVGLADHVHVNAVGADLVGKVELPRSLLLRATVCADHPEQALREGECQQLSANQVHLTLAQICAEPESAGDSRHGPTVFDSTGVAIEDHITLNVFVELARQAGIGTDVDVDSRTSDPLNPYSLSLPETSSFESMRGFAPVR
ncbi:ornithine cyclodeaminase family protein [Solwaraspora sp. WMMB335]|uniref:ornithine cyclodeaminase family protein n=1 Tax=Solwaraspora sp. WMMB335 TaxID=3404118 RepID=UPI003B93BDE6